RPSVAHMILAVLAAAAAGAGLAAGCSATGDRHEFGEGGSSTGTAGGTGNAGGSGGGTLEFPDAGQDAPIDAHMNPCGSGCGPTELCDVDHLGLDDDCDNLVDEDCNCTAGQAHACFKGDPSYHNTAGRYDGTEKCDENGNWGPCIGGVHVP